MAYSHVIVGASSAHPTVRKIGLEDLKDALSKGVDDFLAMPSHVFFLCLIYPIAVLFLARLILGYDVLPLLFPIAAGSALVGPFAAVGLYELSKQREEGRDVSWRHAFDFVRCRSFGAIMTLGLLLTVIFFLWLAAAHLIYIENFGDAPAASIPHFISQILTTGSGWTLIIVGNSVGFAFAALVLTISTISFPLLVDHNIGAAPAVLTSVRVVLANPVTMAMWGLIVAGLLVGGAVVFLLGLAVVLPILGHSTWHLYRKVVQV
jgi:uncharacterized membrane protein